MCSDLFTEFVATIYDGNQAKAAGALGIDRSMASRISRGERSVTPRVAALIESLSGGRYTKEQFIWPDAKASKASRNKTIKNN